MVTKFRISISSLFVILSLLQTKVTNAQCSFSGLNANYCAYSPTVQLTSTLTGGSFSGPGITGSVFNPALAGPGTHTITYAVCPSSYTITSGTYSPYTSSTSTTTSSSSLTVEGTTVSLGDDQMTSSSAPIGFNFNFFCNTYTGFYISSNGFISFSSSQSNGCCSGGTLPGTVTPLNIITATWTDWNPTLGGVISYTTIGTAPNRKLIVSYNNIPHFANTGGNLTAQIHLYETSNVIEIHTASMIPNNSGHTMGIKDVTGTHGGAVPGRNSVCTWSAVAEMYRYTPIQGCVSTRTTYVSPSSVSVAGSRAICFGDSASLTCSGNSTYTWSTGSNLASVNLAPSTSATYSVSGTNNFGCIANSAITVTVSTVMPTVTAVASNSTGGICPGSTLCLNASGAITYTWSNGVTNAAAFSPSIAGVYTVIGNNGCGTSTAAVSVSVHPLPGVTASASSPTICSGSMLMLNGAGASSYVWTPAVVNGSTFTPASSANYTVLGISAVGCTAIATTSITVFQMPTIAPLTSPSLICAGKAATLTSSGTYTNTWLQLNSSASVAIVSPTATTTFTLIQSTAHCSRTRVLTVTVNQLPTVAAMISPTLICAQGIATLAAGGAQTYTWTSPGYTTYGASAVVAPSITTIYTLSASDGTCINTATAAIGVNLNPVLNVTSNNSVICAGDTSMLMVNGALSYTWNPPVSISSAAIVSPTTATNYIISGVDAIGCVGTTAQVILVNQKPNVTATSDKTIVCRGNPVTLTATGNANSYSWSNGVSTETTLVNPLSTTIYSVAAISAFGCKSSNTVEVTVFTPSLSIRGNTAACMGGTAVLISSGCLTYTWSTGSHMNNTTVNPLTTTIYTLSATSNSNGLHCVGTQTVSVDIYPNPTVSVSLNKTIICRGEKAILTGHGAETYVWNNNSALGTTTQVSPTVQSTYTVTGTDSNGCINTGTVLVKVSVCSGIEELSARNSSLIIYPNPNNGKFTIQTQEDLDLHLINELGQVVSFIQLSKLNEHKTQFSDLANGIYFIRGEKNNQVIIQKIVIMK